ncbi:MAG: nuclear transport factor 2 family protein [Rhodovibrionaceae bacterium]
MTREDALTRYARFYAEMSPDSIGKLPALCSAQVRFRDPFNDFTGVDKMIALFEEMYRELEAPRFEVTDRAVGTEACYLRWTMYFRRKGRTWKILGLSEIHFDEAGRVTAHFDHWDSGSQFYARLPLLGGVIRWIARKLAV